MVENNIKTVGKIVAPIVLASLVGCASNEAKLEENLEGKIEKSAYVQRVTNEDGSCNWEQYVAEAREHANIGTYETEGENAVACAKNLFGTLTVGSYTKDGELRTGGMIGSIPRGLGNFLETGNPLHIFSGFGGVLKSFYSAFTDAACMTYNGTVAHVLPDEVDNTMNSGYALLNKAMSGRALGKFIVEEGNGCSGADGILGVTGGIIDYVITDAIVDEIAPESNKGSTTVDLCAGTGFTTPVFIGGTFVGCI